MELVSFERFDDAYEVYSNGGFSKPVADVNLEKPLPITISKFTPVTGTSVDGKPVFGKLLFQYDEGDTKVRVQYSATQLQANLVECRVGGLPLPTLDGCKWSFCVRCVRILTLRHTCNGSLHRFLSHTLHGLQQFLFFSATNLFASFFQVLKSRAQLTYKDFD